MGIIKHLFKKKLLMFLCYNVMSCKSKCEEKNLYTFPIAILTLLIRPHINKNVIIIDTDVGPLAHFQLSKPWLVFNLRKALFIKHQHLFRRIYHSLLQSI